MKIIDIMTWNKARRKSYEWFSSFSNPTYAVSARMEVTRLIELKKKFNRSFFEDMLYLTVCALNTVPALRLRILKDKIVEFEAPAASFTVGLPDGSFDTCRVEWDADAKKFCNEVRSAIDKTKTIGCNKELRDNKIDVYYFTCLPWLNFETMSDPIPDDIQSLSIPRICWGKFVEENKKYTLNMNITVNHALVDGKPLCDAFAAIQNAINNCEEVLKLK